MSIIRNRRSGWLAGLGWCQSAAISDLEMAETLALAGVDYKKSAVWLAGWLGLVSVGGNL